MPRDSAGTFSLVAGNPVESGEVISSGWANTTMPDIAKGLSDSLDRNGRGGMLAPFRFADGTNLAPGATWANEPTTGFYRFDGGDLRIGVLTQPVMRWKNTGTDVWDFDTDSWISLAKLGGRNGLSVVDTAADVTALAGRLYNLTAGGITVTLPANPGIDDLVGVFSGNFDTSIVDPNGAAVNGTAQTIELDLIDCVLVFQYLGPALGWTVVSQALNSAVTGGLPTEGVNDGDAMYWDDTTQRWTGSTLYNLGRDGVFSGVISGDVPAQNLTRIQVVSALPGTPNENVLYIVPAVGVYFGADLVAEINAVTP